MEYRFSKGKDLYIIENRALRGREGSAWIVAFKATQSYEEVVQHIEDCLKPSESDYALCKGAKSNSRTYVSSDAKTFIRMAYDRNREYYRIHVLVYVRPLKELQSGSSKLRQ
jgi:hypothetical protein